MTTKKYSLTQFDFGTKDVKMISLGLEERMKLLHEQPALLQDTDLCNQIRLLAYKYRHETGSHYIYKWSD
jgi:hypothetical protein